MVIAFACKTLRIGGERGKPEDQGSLTSFSSMRRTILPDGTSRSSDSFLSKKLSRLKGRLPGTYVADLFIDSADRTGRINAAAIDAMITQILDDVGRGEVRDVYDVGDCSIRKIGPDGSRAIPWLWDYELEVDDPRSATTLKLLNDEFQRQLANARIKFRDNPAARNLLVIETRGTLIDRLFHLFPTAAGPGVMSSWMAAVSADWLPNDLVVVDPHVSVGQLIGASPSARFRVVLTGTMYAQDMPYTALGTPWRLWPEPAGVL